MYLFRIVFTWRLLAVYILYLTNQTVIAMPPRGRPPKGESTGSGEFTFQANLSSSTTSDPKFMLKTYVLGVANRDTSHDDQKADWVAVMVPEEDLTPSKPEKYFYGYQTLKSPNSDNEWHRQVKSGRKSSLNGVSVIVTENLRLLRIGSVRMSQDTKGYLSTDVRKDVDKDRVDRIPNIPSIYQLMILLHRQMDKPKYEGKVKIIDFDISDSSEFGKAAKNMVELKGTGTGKVLSEEQAKWECALYKRIENGGLANTLEKSLALKNKDILVDLRDEVDPILELINDQDEWDKERTERLALEGSLQS
ncbi:hypothetical protein FB446DRAFT_789696 [Lentinula raphanica]|nr:hypothetical protein FB446DRAFT_789696 [Lentinula raphanica]